MTVRELLARTSSLELSEWIAYEQVAGPLGEMRSDYQTAQVLAMLYNVNRGKRQKAKAPEDFMPRWDNAPQARQQQTPEEQLAIVRGMTNRMGRSRGHDRKPAGEAGG